jgi:hypothetical protein
MMNWAGIVSDYKGHSSHDEVDWFKKQASLENAIRTAAFAIDHRDKQYSHQYKIRRETLEEAYAALTKVVDEIRQSTTFDELLSVIEKAVLPIKGIGELYCYDTAFRIGANRGLFPRKVYLHSGTKKGAKYLGWDYKARPRNRNTAKRIAAASAARNRGHFVHLSKLF